MPDLTTAYHRSAYPALGISLERALREPALRAVLELAGHMQAQADRRAARCNPGRWIERTANNNH